MNGTARHQLRNRMPRGYFADAPKHFGAAGTASSGGSQVNTYAPADTHAAAPLLPANARAGVCSKLRVTAGAVPSAAPDCPGCNDTLRLKAERIFAGTY